MEGRFGSRLDDVHIHTDREATVAARALGARAFTLGRAIAFDEGEYAPETTPGRRLLAHELAHLSHHAGAGDPAVRRQPVDAGVGDAGPTDAGGVGQITNVFRGETVSDDPVFTYDLLKRMYILSGYGAVEDFVHGFDNEHVLPGRPIAGVSDDPEFNRNAAIGATLRAQFEVISKDERSFVAQFEDDSRNAAKDVLEESRKHVEAEAIRYGVRNVHLEFSFWWGIPEMKGEVADNASTRGIAIAAQGLLDRKSKAEEAVEEFREYSSGLPGIVELGSQRGPWASKQGADIVAEKKDKIARTQRELNVYRTQMEVKFPLLAALGNDEDFKRSELEDLTKGAAGNNAKATQVIVDQIVEKLANINKVKAELELKKGGDVNIWRVPKLVNATRDALGAAPGTLHGRMVDDKVKDEQPSALTGILIGLLQIGLVLLAPFTGGLSLLPAAAIGVGTAYSHYKEYELQSALHGTDFGAAALSAEEPSLFWLAVDIVGAGFDVGAAAGAAVRIFRALAPAAKALREAEAGGEAILKFERQAAELGGEALARTVGRDARAMGGASREVGITAEEASKFEKAAADVAEKELPKSAPKAATLAGGEAKVSPSGTIWSCNSPCAMMRERYLGLLARDNNYLQKLEKLEERARKVAAGATDDTLEGIATEAAALEREMRTTALPGDWTSPLKESSPARFDDLVKSRGSVAAELDHHPPGWTGSHEAEFRFGAAGEAEPGYRWTMDGSGALRYDRLDASLPPHRFNAASGKFELAAEDGLIRAVKGAEKTEAVSIASKEGAAMETAFKNRRALIADRNDLEALEKLGPLTSEDATKLKEIYAQINEQSRQLGEQAAEAVMSGKGGKKIYPLTKVHSTSGDFDQVWKIGDEFHIVEAKGGSGSLGARSIGEGMRAEQGTIEYARSIAENMATRGATKEIRALGRELRAAMDAGKVKYVLVRAPIGTKAGVAVLGDVKVSQFVLPAVE